jgi:type I restriction enzyme, S subunit
MLAFPKYECYKDSGVEWLGEIPSHWDLKKNKFLLREKKGTVGKNSGDFTLLSLTLQGVIARDMENPQGKFPAEFNTYKIVEPDDLIFCLFDVEETPRTVGHANQRGMITGAYEVFECGHELDSRYLYYYYLSLDFDKRLQPLYSGLRKVIKIDVFLGTKSRTCLFS